MSKPAALRELDEALAAPDADFAVLVVPSDDKVPAKMNPLREYNGDKLIVVFDPEAEATIALEVAYSLARARVLMAQAESPTASTAGAVGDTVERALAGDGGACARSRTAHGGKDVRSTERFDADRHDGRRACASSWRRSTSWSARPGTTRSRLPEPEQAELI